MEPIDTYYDAHPEKKDALSDNKLGERLMISYGLGLGYSPTDFARWADMTDPDPEEMCEAFQRIMEKYPFTKRHVRAVEPEPVEVIE